MTKTIKNKTRTNKTKTNKTRTNKNKVTSLKKREFIKAILKEWKLMEGCYEKDTLTIYKGDYYLSLNKNVDFYNHIHVILKNLNDIKYVMKKIDKDNNIVHSQEIKIDLSSDPKKIVRSMIKNYKEFRKL